MRKRRRSKARVDISSKVNHVLNLILVALLLITLRCWHLAVVQHDTRVAEASRPQEKRVIEPAKRGTIRDRNNRPLALNRIHYQAAILYSDLQQIPTIQWVQSEKGVKKKVYPRRTYISHLAQLLGETLHLEAERVEDLIHAKAALYYHLPFVIKESLSEEEYYRLRMVQREWPGVHVQAVPKRDYPMGPVASDIIGYMGAISREEYDAFVQEKKALENYVSTLEGGDNPDLPEGVESPMAAWERLQELQRRAYQIHDYVGKMGIEGRFEEELRGFHGKRSYYSDARGNFLRELPGREIPLPGQRVVLTLSAELQEFAEQLLAENETIRHSRLSGISETKQEELGLTDPWIRGGAIVAIDPNSGEVLAMASFPRFDPNDFIASGSPEKDRLQQKNILRWFETPAYLGQLWDQKVPLTRERYDSELGFYEQTEELHWSTYLQKILPKNSPVRVALERHSTIQSAIEVQRHMGDLLTLSQQNNPYWILNALYKEPSHQPHRKAMPAVARDDLEECMVCHKEQIVRIKKKFNPYLEAIPHCYDKVLFVDLCGMVVDESRFSTALLNAVGKQPLSTYRDATGAFVMVEDVAQELARDLYHSLDFKLWREEFGKEFLKDVRAKEKQEKRYARPYIDLYDAEERRQFKTFWEEHRLPLLQIFLTGESPFTKGTLSPYQQLFYCWHEELNLGANSALPWRGKYQFLKQIVSLLPSSLILPYLATFRPYEEMSRPLLGCYPHLMNTDGKQLEKHLAIAFYPRYGYSFARSFAYRQGSPQGSIFKLVAAYEALVQQYEKLGGGALLKERLNPLTIVEESYKNGTVPYIGYDASGKPIPQHYKGGVLIKSMNSHMGRLDIKKAIAVSSNPYFSLLASDVLEDPEDLIAAARLFSYGDRTGISLPMEVRGSLPNDLDINPTGLFATAIGQHSLIVTPLQTATMLAALANGGDVVKPKIVKLLAGKNLTYSDHPFVLQEKPEVVRTLFLPEVVREVLLESLQGVSERTYAQGMGRLNALYQTLPEALTACRTLKGQFVGKTSTAEVVEIDNLDLVYGVNKHNNVWFGGISFTDAGTPFEKPELVVVVFLRDGAYGRDAFPIAAQMIQKWRELEPMIAT